MKICYFDAFSGISGDMTVGALVDAGADWPQLAAALDSLDLGASFGVEKTKRRGIAASKFYLEGGHRNGHRHLPQIERMINAGELTETARKNALAVFRRLGEAEAKSHNVPLDRVHFHEVGAVDSICDIVGACAALDLLDVTEVRGSRINVGSGAITTEHGVLPVPAPATAELLKNRDIYSAGPETELTTPTGAALIATLTCACTGLPPIRLLAQGFGAGEKDFPMQANVLRVLIAERVRADQAASVTIIEATIDDSTPQILGYAMERLLAAGALDVTLTPVFMKKNRPGTVLSAIAPPELMDQLAAIFFAETTTLGLRITPAERRVLAREIAQVETPFGGIRIKYTEDGSFAPEYDDCRAAALQHQVPLRSVIAAANQAFRNARS